MRTMLTLVGDACSNLGQITMRKVSGVFVWCGVDFAKQCGAVGSQVTKMRREIRCKRSAAAGQLARAEYHRLAAVTN